MSLEQRLAEGLQSLAEATPDAHGDLARVKTEGRRRLVVGRVGAFVAAAALVIAAVGSVALLRPGQAASDVAGAQTGPSIAPTVAVGNGRTVSVTVSGVSGHTGHELAGVLYAGGELTDLDREALGGFWAVITDDDSTITEVVREPEDNYVGRFPYVSDKALLLEPGAYTLVVWVDVGLGPVSRWVPINTDGRGLYGCQHVFDIGADTQTNIVVPANLHPDGWNTNCVGS